MNRAAVALALLLAAVACSPNSSQTEATITPTVNTPTVVESLPATEATATPTPTSTPTPTPVTATPTADPTPQPPSGVPADAQPRVVENITDRDTINVRIDQAGGPLPANATHTIRLLQIDTPETVAPNQPVECGGPEATIFTSERLPVGSMVWLEADQEDTDRFGRFLRYVYLSDGRMFNEAALEAGVAEHVIFQPNDRYSDRLAAASERAREPNRGLFGPPCDIDAPPPAPPPPAPAATPPAPAGNCHPSYPDVCIPPPPPDLDCGDIPQRGFRVTGSDPHRFDGDNDGIGCES